MRLLFGCLAVFLGAVSIALAARYGYKGADTIVDGVISAVVFGSIALCAFIFDAAAVRLWFMRHHVGAVVIGVIAAAALVVTFTNSLGAIAGRADTTQAERRKAKTDSASRSRRVEAHHQRARRAAVHAGDSRGREGRTGGGGGWAAAGASRRIRGNAGPSAGSVKPRNRPSAMLWRRRSRTKRRPTTLPSSTRMPKPCAPIAKAPSVQKANPLGETLEQLIGAAAAVLTAWQQAVVAGVFELCLVGVMVIFELLGQDAGGRVTIQGKADPDDRQPDREPIRLRQWRSHPPRHRAGVGPSQRQSWPASKPSSGSACHLPTESGSR